jgi:hypothetical protein
MDPRDMTENELRYHCAALYDEIERLRAPLRNVDDKDWIDIFALLGDGSRAKFWKSVLTEMRAALHAKHS